MSLTFISAVVPTDRTGRAGLVCRDGTEKASAFKISITLPLQRKRQAHEEMRFKSAEQGYPAFP
jgi:hypothetical protein